MYENTIEIKADSLHFHPQHLISIATIACQTKCVREPK